MAYIKHEILEIKHNRIPDSGLAVYKVPSYWDHLPSNVSGLDVVH
jgi:hypothetical protein